MAVDTWEVDRRELTFFGLAFYGDWAWRRFTRHCATKQPVILIEQAAHD